MKQNIIKLLLALTLCACLLLTGCGGSKTQTAAQPETQPAAASAENTAAPAPAAQKAEPEAKVAEPVSKAAPEAAKTASPFVGSWMLYSQEGDPAYTHEDIVASAAQGLDLSKNLIMTLKEDGTIDMYFFGEMDHYTWVDNGDGSASMTQSGETYPMTIADGLLRVDMGDTVCYFEPSPMSAAERAG